MLWHMLIASYLCNVIVVVESVNVAKEEEGLPGA
jgi:hypothetical protein